MNLRVAAPFELLVDVTSHQKVLARWASRNFVAGGVGALLLIWAIGILYGTLPALHTVYLTWVACGCIGVGLVVRVVFRWSTTAGMVLSGTCTALVVSLFTAGVGPALSASVAQSAMLVATTATILFPAPYALLVLTADLATTAVALFVWGGLSVPQDRILVLVVQTALASALSLWFAATLQQLGQAERKAVADSGMILAELGRVDERRRNFLHQMSHQLRTPLNAIIGFSELLIAGAGGPLSSKQQEYVGDIATSGAHLLALVDDVLDIGRIDDGNLALDLRPFPAGRVAASCASLCRSQAEKEGVALAVRVSSDETLVADERKVRQVLLNLVSNAVRATPPGGRVELVVARTGEWFAYTVDDTGPGVADADRERIFRAFEQGGGGAPAGTGLGLAVARGIAEAHGGTLVVEDGAPGARFVLRLPAATPESSPARRRPPEAVIVRRRSILDEGSWLEVLSGADGLARHRARWMAVAVVAEGAMVGLLALLGGWESFRLARWGWMALVSLPMGLWLFRRGTRIPADWMYAFSAGAVVLAGWAAWLGGAGFSESAAPILLAQGIAAFTLFHLRRAVLIGIEVAAVYGLVLAFQPGNDAAAIRWLLTMGLMAGGATLSRWLLGFLPALIESENLARRQLDILTVQLQEAGRHRSEFLANMSHELRTPLNAIIGFATALEQRIFGDLDPKAGEYVSDIAAAGHHLLALINDILDLAKADAGKLGLEMRQTTLDEILEVACAHAAGQAEAKGVGFQLISSPGPDLIADPRRLAQALRYVVTNAVEFTNRGGTVRVIGTTDPEGCRIEVDDDGPGIHPADQDRIFAAFEFAGTHPVHLGAGIGLALASQLVQSHGGSLSVHSTPGQGSRFVLRVPTADRLESPVGSDGLIPPRL